VEHEGAAEARQLAGGYQLSCLSQNLYALYPLGVLIEMTGRGARSFHSGSAASATDREKMTATAGNFRHSAEKMSAKSCWHNT